jgi:hypothetical protein
MESSSFFFARLLLLWIFIVGHGLLLRFLY